MALTALILTLCSCVGAATEYTVNSGSSIQAVVTNASSGDVITIGPGTYTENILINGESNLLIRSSGDTTNTIIANNTGTSVITMQGCTNVTIQGLTVTGAGTDNAGIYVTGSMYCTVKDNIMHDDALGIYLKNSHHTVVSNNTATKDNLPGTGRAINIEQSNYTTVSSNTASNQRYGIYVAGSKDNTISGNTVNLSADDGLVLAYSTNITLENNNVNSNRLYGIYMSGSSGNFLRSNNVYNSTNGINIVSSSGNEISGNTISNSSIYTLTHGIFMNTSSNNVLRSNTVTNTDYGIAMRYSNSNTIVSNNAHDNNRGIYLTLTASANTISSNQANSNDINGIVLENCSGNSIVNNTASSNSANGIYLTSSSSNVLTSNTASDNGNGIYIASSSSGNTISGNTVDSNGDGIRLEGAGINNNLSSNTANSNTNYGIYVVSSNNSYVLDNIAPENSKGIYIVTTSGSTISNNTASSNSADGIMLSLSNSNIVSENTAYENDQYGISLNSSQSNNISSNHVASLSGTAGMYLCPQSTNNLIFNNYLNNTLNVDNNNNGGIWNITETRASGRTDSGRNIAGGLYLGGNYWATPVLKNGHSQITDDNDNDGFADSIYNGDQLTDYLPLVEVYVVLPESNFNTNVTNGTAPLTVQFTDTSLNATEWSWDFGDVGDGNKSTLQNPTHTYSTAGNYTVNLVAGNENGTDPDPKTAVITVTGNVVPVAAFSASATSGSAPLSVTFTDHSQNATEWSWNFGDGASSPLQNPEHTFTAAGTYTVILTVSNGNNSDSETADITVSEGSSDDDDDSSSGGSSHKSGGGGGGGSPEPAKNVEVKELSQVFIANGKAVQFDFIKNATCVVSVSFDSKKTAGKTTTIVEQLKNKSSLVSSLSDGEVYKYFNVWVGNSGFATSSNIENPAICFKVEKSWIQDKKIDQDSIKLNRYSDKKWEQLPVTLSDEDSKYLYFTADVSGYSFFAITGKTTATSGATETEIQPDDSDNSEDMENTGSEVSSEPAEEENTGMPGFEMVYGVAGLLAVFLYRRK